MHKTSVIDWLTYVQNILRPSFVGPFDVRGTFAYNAYGPVHGQWQGKANAVTH